MTLAKFLLSGFGTITILVIGWPIVLLYPTLKMEKATGIGAVAGGFTEAILAPQFWLSAIVLLIFFWYASQLGSKIFRIVLFWIPAVFATVIGGVVFAVSSYVYLHHVR